MFNLAIARYQFTFQVTENIRLPDYAGSMLRGAFGRSLRRISCMTKEKECKSCLLYKTCPYTNIFERPAPESHHLQRFSQVPNGYIIEPPGDWGVKIYQQGELLRFNLVLVGRLIEHLPLIAFSWQRAFGHQVGKGKADLQRIQYVCESRSEDIYRNGTILPYQLEQNTCQIMPKDNTDICLDIQTPLRVQNNGSALSEHNITIDRVILGLAKRLILLSEFHSYQSLAIDFNKLHKEISAITDSKDLWWKDWVRYSSRQKQKMQLGGVMGTWELRNVSPLIQKILYIGQWIHCGKNASFGLGKYKITNL